MGNGRKIVIKNTRIITPYRILNNHGIVIENGIITAVGKENELDYTDAEIYDGKGNYSSPGFIDIHTHGAGDSDFMDGNEEAFIAAAKTQLSHGTTLLLPTTLAGSKKHILNSIKSFKKAKEQTLYGKMFFGMHLEGPYFSPAQKGAQNPAYLRNPDREEYEEILEEVPYIARWSLAPELPGALELGRRLRREGVVASVAHSDGIYEEVALAFENGFSLAAHLYSGMSSIKRIHAYRHLGVIESALAIEEMDVELICDGSHLPPELVKMIYQIKGASRIALITDSMRAAGTDSVESILGSKEEGLPVLIEAGVAKLPDRSAFAGSVATSDWLLRFAWKEADIPLTDVIRMMTSTPARIIGAEKRKGRLAPGMDGDVVIFDENGSIIQVILAGNKMKQEDV